MASSSAITTRVGTGGVPFCSRLDRLAARSRPRSAGRTVSVERDEPVEQLVLGPLELLDRAGDRRPGGGPSPRRGAGASRCSCSASGVSDTSARRRASSASSARCASCSSATASSSRVSRSRSDSSVSRCSTSARDMRGVYGGCHARGIMPAAPTPTDPDLRSGDRTERPTRPAGGRSGWIVIGVVGLALAVVLSLTVVLAVTAPPARPRRRPPSRRRPRSASSPRPHRRARARHRSTSRSTRPRRSACCRTRRSRPTPPTRRRSGAFVVGASVGPTPSERAEPARPGRRCWPRARC